MKIQLNNLSSDGLTIKDTLPLEPLLQRMKEGRGDDILFTEPPAVSITLSRRHDGVVLVGQARCSITRPCGRCLVDKQLPVQAPLEFLIVPFDSGKGEEDADGVIYSDGDSVEVDQPIYEALILSLSLYWSPPINKQGKCSDCGKKESSFCKSEESESTPRGVRLGDLLKKLE